MDDPSHLTQDQLMQALIDDTRLSDELQEHLSTCSSCKEKKDKLSSRFHGLKHLSNRISSASKDKRESATSWPRSFQAKFMFIIIGVIALISIVNLYNYFGSKAKDTEQQLSSNTQSTEPELEPTSPLPEFYNRLVEFSDQERPWWHKETYINGLRLTSDEITKLESAWKERFNRFAKLENALLAGQIDLAIALEEQEFNKESVQRHYQRLWPSYTHLTEERLNFLLKIRTIMGYERFQDLLRLHRY
jgi:hypothetical protein